MNNVVLSTRNIDQLVHDIATEVVRQISLQSAPYDCSHEHPPATRKQAATHLGISLPTLDLLIKTKQIKAFRLGRSVRISWDEIDRYTNGKVDI